MLKAQTPEARGFLTLQIPPALMQRIREWQLEKVEREARLAARGKDLGL